MNFLVGIHVRLGASCRPAFLHQSGTKSVKRSLSEIAHLTRKKNLVLMGSPGAGKTSVGKVLADRFNARCLDVDNDHLESVWGMKVADKLSMVGPEEFLVAESAATRLLPLDLENHIISLTGSNPLCEDAMEHVCRLGLVVLLDVDVRDVLQRLELMKVDRIVGAAGASIADILDYRQSFYERWYDVRVLLKRDVSVDETAHCVVEELSRCDKFVSTAQEGTSSVLFTTAVQQGLAPDGSLYVPSRSLPKWTSEQWRRLLGLPYQDRALRILEKWLPCGVLPTSSLQSAVMKACSMFSTPLVVPVNCLEGNQYLQELYHGPTGSFKDLSLQFMPHLLKSTLQGDRQTYSLVVATSGDTGGAALCSFGHNSPFAVTVFYPHNGVSFYQEMQMLEAAKLRPGLQAVPLAAADFDYCQSSLKKIMADVRFVQKLETSYGARLTTANSINWGRVMPQVVYHASSYLTLVDEGVVQFGDPVDVCIPTGNFGNILAAYYAKCMGVPYRQFLIASNCNNTLTGFIQTGSYDITGRTLQPTISPAIDILIPSNLERLVHLMASQMNDEEALNQMKRQFQQGDRRRRFTVPERLFARLQEEFQADYASEEECRSTLRGVFGRTGQILDPHTAVAKACGDKLTRKLNHNVPMLMSSTAHWSKFADSVASSLGKTVDDLLASTQHEAPVQKALCLLKVQSAETVQVEAFPRSKWAMEKLIGENTEMAVQARST